MNKQELGKAWNLATSDADLSAHPIDLFDGYGLPDFEPVYVTLEQVARLIRWQCGTFAGTWDTTELDGIARRGRRNFMIINGQEVTA